MRRRRFLRAALAATVLAVVWAPTAAAQAGEDGGISFTAELDDQPLEGAGSTDPVEIHPDRDTTVDLVITNEGDRDLTVDRVRLSGDALGITLLAVDTTSPFELAAGEETQVEVPFRFRDLGGQTTGLVPSALTLYDEDDRELASVGFVADVNGSLTSALGLFAAVLFVLTALAVAGSLLAMSRDRQHPNRVVRAVSWASIGVAAGLTVVFGLGVVGIVAPTGGVWIPLLLIGVVGGAVFGYTSPNPSDEIEDEIDEIDRVASGP